jgi:hypothetical protein
MKTRRKGKGEMEESKNLRGKNYKIHSKALAVEERKNWRVLRGGQKKKNPLLAFFFSQLDFFFSFCLSFFSLEKFFFAFCFPPSAGEQMNTGNGPVLNHGWAELIR